MDNYVYIVAGLPELSLTFENSGFSYESVKDYFYPLLSEKDQAIINFFEQGFDEDTLCADFYEKALAHKNRFIRDFFRFDMNLRNRKVKYLGKRLNQSTEKYLIETNDNDFEEEKQVQTIFDNPDFVTREQLMDKLKWKKTNEIIRTDYFNLNVILAFLVKAKMIQRWANLDKAQGEMMFQQLVTEVRGTFKGVHYETKK
ncbi:MAG: DUF2764 domain-containing protein [Bacteroidales bacterium]|nr:DUF2764 domain-containing protein [Bacteroidales bacterium]